MCLLQKPAIPFLATVSWTRHKKKKADRRKVTFPDIHMQGLWALSLACFHFHYKARSLSDGFFCRVFTRYDMSAQCTPIAISIPNHRVAFFLLLNGTTHKQFCNFCNNMNRNPSRTRQAASPSPTLTFLRWLVMVESSCTTSLSFSLSLPQSTSLEPAAWKAFAHSLEEAREREK